MGTVQARHVNDADLMVPGESGAARLPPKGVTALRRAEPADPGPMATSEGG